MLLVRTEDENMWVLIKCLSLYAGINNQLKLTA